MYADGQGKNLRDTFGGRDSWVVICWRRGVFSFFYKIYAAQDIPHAGSSRGSTKISFTATHSGCVAA